MLPINWMFKSQIESTDIYSQGSEGAQLLLQLDSADPKWPSLFLNAQGSDFRIYHRGMVYPVHRNVIFKNMNLHVLDYQDNESGLNAPQELKPELLTGVLSYLYGLELKICRSQVIDVLDVVHFLKVSRLKRLLQEDIVNNFDDYELFPMLERARLMGMEEVEEACLRQLDLEAFEQMRYAKYQLLSCNEDIFKDVVHRHNERKWEDPTFGLSDKFIQQLIQEYCKHNGFNQRKKSQLFKSFNQMSVRSDQPLQINACVPPLKIKQGSDISIKIYTPRAATTESALTSMNYFKSCKSKDHDGAKSMIMDLTFMSANRRRKSSRGSEVQSKICSDVISLKESVKNHDKTLDELKDSIEKMEKSLTQKEIEAGNNKFRLSQVQKLLEECENQLMEDNRKSRLLEARFSRIEDRRMKQGDQFTESTVKEKKEDSSDEEEKGENPKDQNLRVSLIQSKWVCC